ncbi:UNVERIFIED_ORG: hypothetical protein GGI66_003581 [Rhizobium esperanzae]
MTTEFNSTEERISSLAVQFWNALLEIAMPDTLEDVAEQDQVEKLQLIAIKAMSTAPVPQQQIAVSQALLHVAAERRRQIGAEGWTPAHDDEHSAGEMAGAAACYALHGVTYRIPERPAKYEAVADARKEAEKGMEGIKAAVKLAFGDRPPARWPWSDEWWKPKDRRRDLVRAAALLIAEIERLDRASEAGKP